MVGAAGVGWTVRLRRNGREWWLLVEVTSELLLLGATSGQPGWASGAPLAAVIHHAGGGDSYYSAPAVVDGGAGDEGNPLLLMTSMDDDVAVGRSSVNWPTWEYHFASR